MQRFEPIAIVGRGCVFPEAMDPATLWQHSLASRNLIGSAPPGRWGIDPALIARPRNDPQAGNHVLHDLAGYVRNAVPIPVGLADSNAAVSSADPKLSWLLHSGHAALFEAGLSSSEPAEALANAGLIVGNLSYPSTGCTAFAEGFWTGRHDGNPRDLFCSGLPVMAAARALGLGGPSFALDAACASALYAMKLACNALHDGRADVMLAGGVCRTDALLLHIGFTSIQAMSPTGRSRPFAQDADGLMLGEGAGVFALRRLADAERDGQRIFGVIRGIGLSNDGRQRGFLAPDTGGQLRALREAYEMAGLEPADIAYVECHATGTTRGDLVELETLDALFPSNHKPAIGSVKANFGHTMAAAGAAGLLRVLGALETGIIPPTLQTGPILPVLSEKGFRLPKDAQPWPDGAPRRGAVSAFGFGGNNAHMIVEAWQPGRTGSVAKSLPPFDDDIDICALGIVTGPAGNLADFSARWFGPVGDSAGPLKTISLPYDKIGFPPNDLKVCQGQQTALLQAADEALGQIAPLPTLRTGVFVGAGLETTTMRHGLRLRIDNGAAWRAANAAAAPPLDAVRLVGSLPNLPANRLNVQRDFRGCGFTVFSEECSGLDALAIAERALRHGELDAAVVGAVDLSFDAAHRAAAEAVLPPDRQQPGDAAVVLVLKRRRDAEQAGDHVIARLPARPDADETPDQIVLRLAPEDGIGPVTARFGHAHAASGLLHVAAAALSVAAGAKVDAQGAWPWLSASARRMTVEIHGLCDRRVSRSIVAIPDASPRIYAVAAPAAACYAADDAASLIEALAADRQNTAGRWRLGLFADKASDLARLREAAVRQLRTGETPSGPGIRFGNATTTGELAFAFTGAAAAYRGMGRDTLLAWPEVGDVAASRSTYMRRFASEIYRAGEEHLEPLTQLVGAALVSLVQAKISRDVLGLSPTAAIGLSSGESNSLLSFEFWSDPDGLLDALEKSEVYGRYLTGEFRTAGAHWKLPENSKVDWRNYRLVAPVATVKAALAEEEHAYLTIIQGPDDCVIGGDEAACQRVIAKAAPKSAMSLGLDMIVHCAAFAPFAETWRHIHSRTISSQPNVRVYSHGGNRAYEVTQNSAADNLTQQALVPIDFPGLIETAYADGVRTFVEHGPRSVLTTAIGRILGPRPHLAVAFDRHDLRSLRAGTDAAMTLWAAGAECAIEPWLRRLQSIRNGRTPRVPAGKMMRFDAHLPDMRMPSPSDASKPIRPLAKTNGAATPARERSKPLINREQLEYLAVGRIADILGPTFAGQASFHRQVRMPTPPMLLADRVTEIEGEPGSMGKGRLVTETDILASGWYIHAGHMIPGALIEAGQADLLLISYLGIDNFNRSERVYRLLGGLFTFSDHLPVPGETLRYDIRVKSHARTGDIRLFFFQFDCIAYSESGERNLMSLRDGQAGFFTDAELAASAGVLWDAASDKPGPQTRYSPPPAPSARRSFSAADLDRLIEGDVRGCFGPGFEAAASPNSPSRIPGGKLRLIDSVPVFDPVGGPWGRGYLLAEATVPVDAWFYNGHFHNDPCMPGTLMLDAAVQAFSFLMIAMGFAIGRDGWYFEPVPGVEQKFLCRGQVVPNKPHHLKYEVFVEEIIDGPEPMLMAALLCSSDGLKIFHCRRVGLQLVPMH